MSVIFYAWILLHLWLLLSANLVILSREIQWRKKASRRIESSPSPTVSLPRCRATADPARPAPYCVDAVTDAAWSPSCLQKDATMCFILLTFSSAAAPVTKWDQPPSCLAFSFFIKEKPNALETVRWLMRTLQIWLVFFFFLSETNRAESCKEQLWKSAPARWASGFRCPCWHLTRPFGRGSLAGHRLWSFW